MQVEIPFHKWPLLLFVYNCDRPVTFNCITFIYCVCVHVCGHTAVFSCQWLSSQEWKFKLLPPPMLGCCLAWSCLDLMHLVTATIGSCVQWPWTAWCHCRYPSPFPARSWSMASILTPELHGMLAWASRGGGWRICAISSKGLTRLRTGGTMT